MRPGEYPALQWKDVDTNGSVTVQRSLSRQKLASFTDVRELQRQLKAQAVQLQQEADESTTGPASFVAVDADGNPILVDQHV